MRIRTWSTNLRWPWHLLLMVALGIAFGVGVYLVISLVPARFFQQAWTVFMLGMVAWFIWTMIVLARPARGQRSRRRP